MENVAGAQRIHGVDREGQRVLRWPCWSSQIVPFARASPPNDGVALRSSSASPSSAMPAVSCSGWNAGCDDAFSKPSRSDIARSTSTTTGMPRRRASAPPEYGAEFRSTKLGEDGSDMLGATLGAGRPHLPQLRITGGARWCAAPLGSTMTVEMASPVRACG